MHAAIQSIDPVLSAVLILISVRHGRCAVITACVTAAPPLASVVTVADTVAKLLTRQQSQACMYVYVRLRSHIRELSHMHTWMRPYRHAQDRLL